MPRYVVVFIFMLVSIVGRSEGTAKLTVGIKESPPFTIKTDQGGWGGLVVDLWEKIAEDNGLTYEYRELPLKELLEETGAGKIDLAVAALTITSEREATMDFSQPFYTGGLGMAVRNRPRGWLGAIKPFLSLAFMKALGALALVLFIFGFLVWLFERKGNSEQFPSRPVKGIWASFWWSGVTMTTVGYGDKAPVTLGGRLVAMVWMFTSVIIISSFTAAITSSLTINQLGTRIKNLADLKHARVGTIKNSTAHKFLEEENIISMGYPTMTDGLRAVANGSLDAFIYDAPILRYLIRQENLARLSVIPIHSSSDYYGLAFPHGSSIREGVNRTLLRFIATPWWNREVEEYLGTL